MSTFYMFHSFKMNIEVGIPFWQSMKLLGDLDNMKQALKSLFKIELQIELTTVTSE